MHKNRKEVCRVSKNEEDARALVGQLKALPEAAQEKVGYIIQGAALVAGNYVARGATVGVTGGES